MRQLVVEVQKGLCNRLRTLVSASYLAQWSGRQLVLCWRPDPECGASFTDLFTNRVTQIDSLPSYPPLTQAKPAPTVLKLPPVLKSAEPVVCLSTDWWLLPPRHWPKTFPHFFALRPVPAVARAANTLLGKFRRPTIPVGVHVRRGDFGAYLARKGLGNLPPLERYFERLNSWGGPIFLATDGGSEVEGPFRERYGARLMVHPKRPGRDTPEAVQDALVDLYVLQRCRAILGTQHSSFTSLASIFTGVPCVRLAESAVQAEAIRHTSS